MPASVEKHSPAPQPTTLENPAIADGQKPEAGSCRDKSTQAVFTNNDAPCNGVAPSGKQSTNGEIVRCSDHETGVDLAFASSQQLEAGSCSSDDPVTRCTDDPIVETESQLEQIMDFLQRYLVCTDSQRLV